MTTLTRTILREFRQARGSLAAIIAVVAVGVTCVVSMGSAYDSLKTAQREYYDRCRMADFWVDLRRAPRDAAETAALEADGVIEAQSRIVFPARAAVEGVAEPVSGIVVSLPEERPAGLINDVALRSGGWFTPTRREEVILHDPFARAHGLRAGDRIELILNNRLQTVHVVGTATSAEFVYLVAPGAIAPDPERYGVFYVKERFAEEAFDFEGACNQIVGRLTAERARRPRLAIDQLEQSLDAYGVFEGYDREDNISHRLLSDEIEGAAVMATVLPAIFLGVSALVLNIMMTRLAELRRTSIGTLKALGYGDRAMFGLYMGFALLVALAGAAVGSGLGCVIATGLTEIYRQFYEFPSLTTEVNPALLVAGTATSVLFAGAGALRGTWIVLKLQPAQAMRPKPPRAGGRVLLERWPAFWRRLGFRWRFALRGALRGRGRTGAGVFASMMGAALLMLTFSARDSVEYMIAFQFEKALRSDYDLLLKDERHGGAALEARRLPGVRTAEPLLLAPVDLRRGRREHKATITGVDPSARLTAPHHRSGRPVPIPRTGLLLSEALAERMAVRAGGTLALRPVRGDRRPREATVTSVAPTFIGMGAYADRSWLAGLLGEADAVSAVQVKLEDGQSQREAFFHAVQELPGVETVAPRATQREELEELLRTQLLGLAVLIGFSGVLFLGSVLTSSLISLAERTREIATLRALGAREREVGSLFLRESMVVHMTGAVLGVPLGGLMMLGVAETWATEFFRVPVVVTWGSVALTLAASAGFVLLAHAFVARRVRRMDWRGAINISE